MRTTGHIELQFRHLCRLDTGLNRHSVRLVAQLHGDVRRLGRVGGREDNHAPGIAHRRNCVIAARPDRRAKGLDFIGTFETFHRQLLSFATIECKGSTPVTAVALVNVAVTVSLF